MRVSLLLLFLSLTFFGLTQKLNKSFDSYKATNGQVFDVGSTVYITSPGDFSNNFLSITTNKKRTNNLRAVVKYVTPEGVDKQFDNRMSAHTISFFLIDKDGNRYAVLDKIYKYYIDIEKAIKYNEILTINHRKSITNKKKVFHDTIAFIKLISMIGSVNKEYAQEFGYRFKTKRFIEVKNDEFEYNRFINKIKNKLSNLIPEYADRNTFKIYANINFGKYDFDKKGFPIIWDNIDNFKVLKSITTIDSRDIDGEFVKPTDLRVLFSNYSGKYSFLPLSEERANYLIKYRKKNNGGVNRKFMLKIYFNIENLIIKKLNNDITKEFKINKTENRNLEFYLISKINKIDFFEDKELYNYLNTVK